MKLKQNEFLQPELEREKTREMLEIASTITPQAFYESLLIFTQKAMHDDILHVLARLYYMLPGDAAMSTVAPFDSHELLQLYYDWALVDQPSEKDLQELKTYCVELAQLIMFGITHVTSVVFESKDDPTQMTKAVIYNYILYYIQKTIHSKLICTNVHS